jgi:probable rRNA maturation factor
MNNTASPEATASPEEPPESDPDPERSGYRVLVADEQSALAIDQRALIAAVRSVFVDSPFRSADVSLAIVDDPTIHQLNARYLDHDYPTDVLSFVLDEADGHLEGEVIVSGDTAIRTAAEAGWSAHDELRLYVIHGTLHLVGYLDKEPQQRRAMLEAEVRILQELGAAFPSDCSRWQDWGIPLSRPTNRNLGEEGSP